MKLKELNIEFLHELLICDSLNGILIWKRRPETDRHIKRWNARYAGKVAGCLNEYGYIQVKINKKPYKTHRIIWAMTYGYWPINDIDHRDGVGSHNWIDNLREATVAENGQNRKLNVNNKSGYTGVFWYKRIKKWCSQIRLNKKAIHLGYYDTQEEAYDAHLAAKCKLHEFQPIPR